MDPRGGPCPNPHDHRSVALPTSPLTPGSKRDRFCWHTEGKYPVCSVAGVVVANNLLGGRGIMHVSKRRSIDGRSPMCALQSRTSRFKVDAIDRVLVDR